MFDYLDPGGKNVTLNAQKFHDWSVEGRADANFKYAVAQLPTATGFAHVGELPLETPTQEIRI